MKHTRYTALFLIVLLSGCLMQARQDLAQCTAQVNARYPASSPMPMGQPYKDIYGCMWNAGYDLDSNLRQCGGSDYTASITNPECYRPKNFITGYFHDIASLFR